MARKKLPLVLPFRYIKKSDARQPFDNELLSINNIDLKFLIDYVETISTQYDYKKVVLDSIPQMISYYESLGYRMTNLVQPDERFITLTRMEKQI